jgi:phosphate:Na+ symporter
MNETRTLISLLGEIALLLWGVHMVHSGVVRAFGSDLRRLLAQALKTRARAFLAGVGVTAALQSSTATGLMASGFAAAGAVELTPALALMLGAGVGTALIVQVFAFDVGWIYPLLIFAGLIAFRVGQRSRTKDLGRVGIGLGLMLLSLHLLIATVTPAASSPVVRDLLAQVTGDPVFCLLLAGILAWAAHSSVAAVLIIMSLAAGGVISPEATCALVVGANLGSALNPVLEAGAGSPSRLRLPLGNLGIRLVGGLAALASVGPASQAILSLDPAPARLAAWFHLAFNLGLAAVFILPLPLVSRMLRRWLPEGAPGADPAQPRYLDRGQLGDPAVAIANAARETLRMADTLETMLRGAGEVLSGGDRKRAPEVKALDDTLDGLNGAIGRYLSDVDHEDMAARDAARLSQVVGFCTNLEHAGDIVSRNLLEQASKKIKRRVSFSAEGAAEIEALQARLLENLQLAVNVFMSGDAGSAERLLRQKRRFRELEREAASAHFDRLRRDVAESLETSGLHLDVIRDLARVNSHIASVAYPVLEGVTSGPAHAGLSQAADQPA